MYRRIETNELKSLGMSEKALKYYEETSPLTVRITPRGAFTLEGVDVGKFDTFDELNSYLTGCAEALEELEDEE